MPKNTIRLEDALSSSNEPTMRVAASRGVDHADEVQHILESIQTLDPTERDVLLLRYVEELSIDNIAQSLALPIGTVKSRIHRGKIKLLELLNPNEKLHEPIR